MSLNTKDIPLLIKWVLENLKDYNVDTIDFDVAVEGGHRVKFTIEQVKKTTKTCYCDDDSTRSKMSDES